MRLHAALPANYDALSKVRITPSGCYVAFEVGMPRGVVLLSAPADGAFLRGRSKLDADSSGAEAA